jgi:hypothetical protein
MKNLLFVLMAMLVLSCGPNPTLIDFDDLSTMTVLKNGTTNTVPVNVGDQFQVGDILTENNSGVRMIVMPFQWKTTPIQWTSDGFIQIEAGNKAGGGGNEVHFNNATLGIIQPSNQSIIRAELKFADFGGNINLIENGAVRNENDFTAITSPTPTGLILNVNASPTGGALKGMIELSGTMNSFTFPGPMPPIAENKQFQFVMGGGQELWIDDLEFWF